MSHFDRLFSPKTFGQLTLKNRIIMAPIDTNLADQQGRVTDSLLAYYQRRAIGGVAMIIVENSQVDFPRGKNTLRQLSIYDDDTVEGLKKLSEAIHRGGALAAIQIHHAGRQTTTDLTGGMVPVAPSAIPCGHLKTPVKELNRQEIEEIIDRFIAAAPRAKRAGFDLIEIHGAHGYLIGEFLSPYTNRRTDEYGGDFSGRMRFAVEIIRGIKEEAGRDFPISFRYSADEFIPGGIILDEGVKIAKVLEDAGVDLLHVSAGIYESLPTLLEPMSYPQGWRCYLAEAVKAAVQTPVVAVGVIREPAFAEKILAEGKADFVAMGRGLLTDPDWPKKVAEGRESEISRCIGCNEGCLSRRLTDSILCSLNPETGRERSNKILPTRKNGEKLTIVGAGPAGLEAARVAALRGFEVTLFEKGNSLGGQMRLAATPPGKDKIWWTIEYYEKQIQRLGIDARLGENVGLTEILETSPRTLIIATGSSPAKPDFSGIGSPLSTPDEILLSKNLPKADRAAVIGAGGIGCETALFLSEKGIMTSIFEQLADTALDVEPITRWDLRERMERSGINIITNCKVLDIEGDRLIASRGNEKVSRQRFDLFVWAAGRTPDQSLTVETKKGSSPFESFVIGDARAVGKIHDAIHSGFVTVAAL